MHKKNAKKHCQLIKLNITMCKYFFFFGKNQTKKKKKKKNKKKKK
jgi:hypothetical protein